MALRIGYCYVYMGVRRGDKGEKSFQHPCVYNVWYKTPESICQIARVSAVLNKYIMGVWSNNFTTAFFISFIVTGFGADIKGIQNKAKCV